MRIPVVLLSLLLPLAACDDGEEDSLEEVVADYDDVTLQVAQAECDSPCAAASPISSCGATPDVSESPTPTCELDALAIDEQGVRQWTQCYSEVETQYADCLLAPSCTDATDYISCGDERQLGRDGCGELPLAVEDALEVCEAERDAEQEDE